MLKLNTKCWISAFNAQGSRGIIVLQVGAVKTYVAAVEALRKKERQDETQEPSKLMVFWVSPPQSPLECYVLFWQVFKKSHPVIYDQTQGTGAVFSWLYSVYWCCLFLTLLSALVLCFPDFTQCTGAVFSWLNGYLWCPSVLIIIVLPVCFHALHRSFHKFPRRWCREFPRWEINVTIFKKF
jgi:hypothetical protein